MESLESYRSKSLAAARAAFVEGCWRDRPLDELLDLAERAGLETREADRIRETILELQGDLLVASEFARLDRVRETAAKRFEARKAEVEAEIERLEDEVAWLGLETEAATKTAAVAEAARGRVRSSDLVPAVATLNEIAASLRQRDDGVKAAPRTPGEAAD